MAGTAKFPRVRIVSDGLPYHTKVYTEDGAAITGIRKITWTTDYGNEPAIATLEMEVLAEVDVVGKLHIDSDGQGSSLLSHIEDYMELPQEPHLDNQGGEPE